MYMSVQGLQVAVCKKTKSSAAITVDTISDVFFDRVVHGVAYGVEEVIDDCANKVIEGI